MGFFSVLPSGEECGEGGTVSMSAKTGESLQRMCLWIRKRVLSTWRSNTDVKTRMCQVADELTKSVRSPSWK